MAIKICLSPAASFWPNSSCKPLVNPRWILVGTSLEMPRTAWRMQDGYFVGGPLSITRSKDEYEWIATEAGPVPFDGVQFVP